MSGPGTSSGRPQSAVLVPVPAADEVLGRWRAEHDPVATAGVPAHVTLVVPWLAPEEITPQELAELDEELSSVTPFDFELRRTEWFGRRVLWVAPDPDQPFTELTHRLSERFATPPYEDEFEEVVPHLTVAHASDGVELRTIAAEVEKVLPLRCRAEEVWVMVSGGARWELRHRRRLS